MAADRTARAQGGRTVRNRTVIVGDRPAGWNCLGLGGGAVGAGWGAAASSRLSRAAAEASSRFGSVVLYVANVVGWWFVGAVQVLGEVEEDFDELGEVDLWFHNGPDSYLKDAAAGGRGGWLGSGPVLVE